MGVASVLWLYKANTFQYGPRAVNCKNKYPDDDCVALFGTAVKVNADTDRDPKCYKNAAGAADEARKELVISACPQTCGYCCLTPPYNCKNKEFPRITCSSITEDMCASAKWKDIITQDCPNVCGFCQEGNCVDIAPGCAKDLTICRNVDMQQFVKCVLCEIHTLPGILPEDVWILRWIWWGGFSCMWSKSEVGIPVISAILKCIARTGFGMDSATVASTRRSRRKDTVARLAIYARDEEYFYYATRN
ncbi:shTK domain protein [Ancylostoma caninum]|uniref:ShTK domain protein n=1 Tax=Ancylostoma caninum TaxID=29170 RepID=A0A368FW65_ANCCA|nr:shTK domain protein [Ancylostoma caninum]